ncbi:SDR family NAD(P)-dependent oxidoreductase [Oceaniglobus trochenteri]|uniref:SDR family NAD(P)-dependent oxidoreductase n=1 Tax=Oceaniglobus trochenteri TaxID=2763260 RepID=UPI001CFFB43A|nr:SDR family oxidoreductase [Oceaniglobus trochenteri]
MTRNVIVIGGTSGIGRAIAEGFLEAGDSVTVSGHEAACDLPGGMAQAVLDVRDGAAVADFLSGVAALDVLVNCAGVIRRGGAEFTAEGFADVIDINLNGTQRCCIAAHGALKAAGGCVINTASMLTYFGSAVAPGYAASKGGIGQLTRSLAMAWAPDGIRVNALAPGWISTALTQPLGDNAERSAAITGRTPMNRWGRPEDLVGPALFLASPAAGFVTGAILPVDGGYSAA